VTHSQTLEQVVFAHAAPAMVIVTTPSRGHNIRFESLPAGEYRHRFEWTRAVFGGHRGLERFVAGEPLHRVHECVFRVLAMESTPVDPRV
jgi:hypothetical protein